MTHSFFGIIPFIFSILLILMNIFAQPFQGINNIERHFMHNTIKKMKSFFFYKSQSNDLKFSFKK